MSGAVVTLRGIKVRVVHGGDISECEACAACVFKGVRAACPDADEERAAGIEPCHRDGHHYIEEEEYAQA